MELEELKTLWSDYDKKLDKSLQLNIKLLRQVNFDKVYGKVKTLIIYKTLEMLILIFMLIYLIKFAINNFPAPGLTGCALISAVFMIAAVISDIRQMAILVQLRSDYSAPVSALQKQVEKLKLLIVNYVKWSLISIPCYPVFLVVAAKIFLNSDLWSPRHFNYLLINLIIGIVLLPGFTYLYRQLNKPVVENRWVKNLLTGSGWNQAASAQTFLDEIEKFEKGE